MAIVFILILGFVLRLVNLNQSLWLDETVQAITSRGTFLGIFSELQGDFHPPLYHLLMWGWTHLFGSGEIAMRLPSVFFGTAAIFMVYKIAQRIFPQKNWLWLVAALFMATAPFHIYYSQEARMYAQTTFFAALSTYFFLGLIGKEKGNRAGYLFSTLLLFYSDYYGLLVFLAQILAALVIFKKDFFKFLFKLWSTFLLIVVLFLPCLPLLWVQLQTGSQATFALPQWGRLVNLSFLKALPLTFIKFSLGRITIFNKS
ncbi:hypothetical protein FJZ41_01720, partial [Candidatus Shapirobacteria bacterium]|nr:hypothetical protein [Candidatus Shapirobacteria bacterium]